MSVDLSRMRPVNAYDVEDELWDLYHNISSISFSSEAERRACKLGIEIAMERLKFIPTLKGE